jgi:hypothetical protein
LEAGLSLAFTMLGSNPADKVAKAVFRKNCLREFGLFLKGIILWLKIIVIVNVGNFYFVA